MAIGYSALAIGAIVSLWLFSRTIDRLDRQTDILTQQALALREASGLFCEASRRGDKGEILVLRHVSQGKFPKISPMCQRVVDVIFSPEVIEAIERRENAAR